MAKRYIFDVSELVTLFVGTKESKSGEQRWWKDIFSFDLDDLTPVKYIAETLNLPELNNFILPGGCEGAALSYQSRTVCRRAERVMIGLSEKYEVDDLIKQYLNRLSDLLFVLGRWLNKQEGVKEESWVKG